METQSKTGILRADEATYEGLSGPSTLEDWHKALLLPESLYVVDCSRIIGRGPTYYELTVTHEDIPLNSDPHDISILPSYFREYIEGEQKPPVLDHIDICHWDGKKWEVVKTIRKGE